MAIFFDEGDVVQENIPLVYALLNLAASYDPADKLYTENRDKKLRDLEQKGQVTLGQDYTRRLANASDFTAELITIIKPKVKADVKSNSPKNSGSKKPTNVRRAIAL